MGTDRLNAHALSTSMYITLIKLLIDLFSILYQRSCGRSSDRSRNRMLKTLSFRSNVHLWKLNITYSVVKKNIESVFVDMLVYIFFSKLKPANPDWTTNNPPTNLISVSYWKLKTRLGNLPFMPIYFRSTLRRRSSDTQKRVQSVINLYAC